MGLTNLLNRFFRHVNCGLQMKICLDTLQGTKDFQAFWVGLVTRLTSAEFAFLFMVSYTIDSYFDK